MYFVPAGPGIYVSVLYRLNQAVWRSQGKPYKMLLSFIYLFLSDL